MHHIMLQLAYVDEHEDHACMHHIMLQPAYFDDHEGHACIISYYVTACIR
jgi:hypothetical protein